MNPNKISYSGIEINDLIDDAVANAIARRSGWETLSDREAARVAGGQAESFLLEEADPIYLPKDPICVPIQPTKPPIKFICTPMIMGKMIAPTNKEVLLS
jgi:hypothetical protein